MRADQIERFYLSLSRCGEMASRLAEKLKAAGFAAVVPRDEFIESFAVDEQERASHRQFGVEIAKMQLSRQEPAEWWGGKVFYQSSFVEALRQRRDTENGCSTAEIRTKYPGEIWRQEIDPCQARMTFARMKDASFRERWQSVIDAEAKLVDRESKEHATGLGEGGGFDPESRYKFLDRVLRRDLPLLGFAFDEAKSSLDYSVYSRRIMGDLDLCWTLEEVDGFTMWRDHGNYRPSLQLRRANAHGTMARAAKKDPANILVVAYNVVLPNFGVAYWRFRNLNELETIAKAHLCLLGLLLQPIESAVREAFA